MYNHQLDTFIKTADLGSFGKGGEALYEDAKALIHFLEDALEKAMLLAESSESTLRIGTSLLYKC